MAYAFHDRVFDPASGLLAGPNASIQLRRQAAALLEDLIERRARWVTPRELQTRIWRDTRVSPSSLSTLLHEVRRAVGDDGRAQQVIRTCRLRGYRFIAALAFEVGPDAADEFEGVRDAPLAIAHSTHSIPSPTPIPHPSPSPGPGPASTVAGSAAETGLEAAMARADRSLRAAEHHGPRHLEVSGASAESFSAEWIEVAADRGWQVHRGRRTDDACPALFSWWQVAQSIRGAAEAAGETRNAKTWTRLCAETDAVIRHAGPAAEFADRQRQFALLDGLTRALLSWATHRPTAIWLADLDERDPGTTRLLTFVLSSTPAAPLWILTSQRRRPAQALQRLARTDHIALGRPVAGVGPAAPADRP